MNLTCRSADIVPFRETNLTKLFQNYFVGKEDSGEVKRQRHGLVSMFVNISSCASTFDHTLQVLRFSSIASKVRRIHTHTCTHIYMFILLHLHMLTLYACTCSHFSLAHAHTLLSHMLAAHTHSLFVFPAKFLDMCYHWFYSVCVCVCVCMCVYVCVCVCVCVGRTDSQGSSIC